MKKQVYKLGLVAFLGLNAMTFAQVQDGVVGINTESPNATLDVRTKAGATKSLRVENTSAEEIVTVLNNGRVGVGVANPSQKLEVVGTIKSTDGILIASKEGVTGPALSLENPSKAGAGLVQKWRLWNMTGPNYTNSLQFWGYDGESNLGSSKMMLTDNGNLAIGFHFKHEPTERLEVSGSIKSTALAGEGVRNVAVDEEGKLVVGEAASTGGGANSAVYRNVRTDNGTSIDISDTDFFIHLTNQAGGTINLPDATASQGRELCFFNSGSDGFATGAEGNGASVQPSAGTCIISVDGVWVTKNSY